MPSGKQLENLVAKGRGRGRGIRNKIPQNLKQSIVDAAIAHGSDGHGRGGLTGYGFFLASRHPKAFAGLLGKLLPLQVDASVSTVLTAVNILPVPAGSYIAPDQRLRILSVANLDQNPVEREES